MEESIRGLNESLASFCNNLQSSCDALRKCLDRRPIPLDSATTTFIQSLNRRVSHLSKDLNLLESMSFGTVSFEELLGHCNQVYKSNQTNLIHLHGHLQSRGLCNSELEVDDVQVDLEVEGSDSVIKSLELDDSSSFEDSLSLRNLGLSDVCLADIEAEGNGEMDEVNLQSRGLIYYEKELGKVAGAWQNDEVIEGVDRSKSNEASIISVSKDDYDSLPSYVKSLSSWEDLQSAVEKLNLSLKKKQNTKESNCFCSEEFESLGLGPKVRSYFLLLVRIKRLLVEAENGVITYRVL